MPVDLTCSSTRMIIRILWSRQQRYTRMSRPRGTHVKLEDRRVQLAESMRTRKKKSMQIDEVIKK